MARKAFISTTEPENLPEEFQGWLWLEPSTGEIKEFNGNNWVVIKTLSFTNHSHPTHGDINFTGTVSVGAVAGITGDYEGAFKKIKIVNGIVTEFELEE